MFVHWRKEKGASSQKLKEEKKILCYRGWKEEKCWHKQNKKKPKWAGEDEKNKYIKRWEHDRQVQNRVFNTENQKETKVTKG